MITISCILASIYFILYVIVMSILSGSTRFKEFCTNLDKQHPKYIAYGENFYKKQYLTWYESIIGLGALGVIVMLLWPITITALILFVIYKLLSDYGGQKLDNLLGKYEIAKIKKEQ